MVPVPSLFSARVQSGPSFAEPRISQKSLPAHISCESSLCLIRLRSCTVLLTTWFLAVIPKLDNSSKSFTQESDLTSDLTAERIHRIVI